MMVMPPGSGASPPCAARGTAGTGRPGSPSGPTAASSRRPSSSARSSSQLIHLQEPVRAAQRSRPGAPVLGRCTLGSRRMVKPGLRPFPAPHRGPLAATSSSRMRSGACRAGPGPRTLTLMTANATSARGAARASRMRLIRRQGLQNPLHSEIIGLASILESASHGRRVARSEGM